MNKQARMFLDIETCANPENCALMPEPIIEAPANYKDPIKIAEYIAEKTAATKAAAIEKAALDPDYGKILSIGYATSPDGPVTVHLVGEVYYAENVSSELETDALVTIEYAYTEKDLIEGFWMRFAQCGGYCVGFNVLGFDLPYLLRRSMALGIHVPFVPNLAKFRCEPVTDLMMILYNWGSDRYKGLKQVARLYGIQNDCPDVDGSTVKDLTPQQLREYQASDIKLTIALYQKMNRVYFNH
jgi:DNA polymerase elongation subunit (family B)